MIDVKTLLHEIVSKEALIGAAISNPVASDNMWGSKVSIRPVQLQGARRYQLSFYKDNKAYHKNLSSDDFEKVLNELVTLFKQSQLFTEDADYHILHLPTGITCRKRAPTQQKKTSSHNRQKQHLLAEGTPDAYLIGLGVMSENGKIIASKAHKFRQINRFLELVDHSLSAVASSKPLHIVDLGCGKAYLTFALYHYLREIKKMPVKLTGVDLKQDVLAECRALAAQLGYTELKFVEGTIDDFSPTDHVDVVVALHACNTATDHALAKALEWKSDFIFAAPCCQHELYTQIRSEPLTTLLQHGILKERFAALVTDAARADLLEAAGYQTQIVEFVDLEHSPKNLMIRAERKSSSERQQSALMRYQELKSFLHITPTLEKLMSERNIEN